MDNKEFIEIENEETGTTRRQFIQGCSAILGSAMLTSGMDMAFKTNTAHAAESGGKYDFSKPENMVYSVCLQCNTGCGIKVKIEDGYGVKIDGNPYNPFNMVPNIAQSTSLKDAARVDAAVCPKGQAGVQVAYDPYRIKKVLKRAGKRGEGKWVAVPFDQAVNEIVNGGKLFSNVAGEENRTVEGLKDLWAIKDSDTAKRLDAAIAKIYKEKDKKKAVADFKAENPDLLQYLIDPDHPDLGARNNQVVYMWGRKKGGRAEFFKRFFNDYYGTTNTHGHTTVCQGSLYFACKALSEQYVFNKFSDGQKFYFQADLANSKFVLFIGANLFEANYGPTNRTVRITERLKNGELATAVADPRFTKLASKSKYYLPVTPGTDAALCFAIMNWMFSNDKIDRKYLSCANKKAAEAAGESTWSNAPILVKIDEKGNAGKFLRASEIGLAENAKVIGKDGKENVLEYLVAMVNGVPTVVDYNNDVIPAAVAGDLFVDTVIDDGKGGKIKVKSSLQLLKEEAMSKSLEDWAKICGSPAASIKQVAKELTSYGKMAAVDVHRGPAQHTNGFYNITAAMNINMLLGNYDWKGGMIVASTYNYSGGKDGQPFNFGKSAKGKLTPTGISNIRHNIKYEDSTLFAGYPAKRNWWPLASDVYEEIIPSIGHQYPYPVKILFSYMGASAYSLPAGHTNIDVLADVDKLPLYICSDILVGPNSLYADYIFPDLTYLERWEMQGSHPNMASKVQPVRQPAIAPITDTVTVYGVEQPISFESTLLALAEKLNMKGFGANGLGDGVDFRCMDDLYVRFVANVATDGKPVPDATDEELAVFLASRKHLPKTVFDPERWAKIAGDNWRKVVYVLNRGGRFQEYTDIYKGDKAANQYKKSLNLYQEKTAGTKNAFTGKQNPGYAKYLPVVTTTGQTPKEAGLETAEYSLSMITHRDITQTKSRTITGYWLLTVYPENSIILNPADAAKMKLKAGDKVKVTSVTNKAGEYDLKNGWKKPMVGKVTISETMMPGVMSFTLGHGHWATGSHDITVDGRIIKGDPRRAAGVHANAAMWVDPHLGNTCMLDTVGGSVSFYDTKVKLVRI